MIIKIPYKALSANKMYLGAKVISPEYKRFQKDVGEFLKLNVKKPVNLTGNLVMTLEVGYSNPLSDTSNAIKSVEDVLASNLGFNDKQIVSHHIHKYLVDKGKEYMVVKLQKTRKNIDRRSKKDDKRSK